MPKPLMLTVLTLGLLLSALCNATDSYEIDQRDPRYQIAIAHLADAAKALAVAKKELQLAEANHPLPGLSLVRMLSQIEPVEETLNVILMPERKRYKYQTIQPDGMFFTPLRVGEK